MVTVSDKHNTSLMRRKQHESRFDISSLFEFSTHINATTDLSFILSHYLLTIMGKILAPRGVLLLCKKDSQYEFTVSVAKGTIVQDENRVVRLKKIPRGLVIAGKRDTSRLLRQDFFRQQRINVILPLRVKEKNLGLACFGLMIDRQLSSVEETYIKSLSNIAAAAIEKSLMIDELKQVNRTLDTRIQELNTLFELSKEFNAVFDSQRLLKLLSFSLLGQLGTNRYFICLEKNNEIQLVQSKLEKPLEEEVLKFLSHLREPVILQQSNKFRRGALPDKLRDNGIEVIVPLKLHEKSEGILGVGRKLSGTEYTQADIEFLTSLGNIALLALENARLFKEAIEKQKLEDELLIAKEIQRGLLPSVLPNLRGVDYAAINLSSKQVGGDYYDVIPLTARRCVIAIGDVSGKGPPAALLMANLQATIRALSPLGLSLAELTTRVNNLICDSTSSSRFITFFWGIFDCETNMLRYVNAGHNPPYLFRNSGAVERLTQGGMVLGVLKKDVPYHEGETKLDRGDVLVLFTDGVTEAMDNNDTEFGEERLEKIVISTKNHSARTILSAIVNAVQEHSRGEAPSDDITLVVLKATK
jgi:sigma-B regulation protein RsbU (phosphoserine phosphatase)